MRFLVDAQLPPALARWLAANGHTAEHVADRQLEAASDSAIWACALREAAAIITKDEDFAERKALSDTGPAVVWIRLPNTRRRELLARFESVLPDILSALEQGDALVEVI
jgi:predicted nuclease of predicted toxin-antitoxin system